MIRIRKGMFIFSLFTVLFLTVTIVFLACDGGGDSSSQTGGQTSTINGRVSNVVARSIDQNRSFFITKLKDLIFFTQNADAQGSDVSGINVTAEQNGDVIDSDITDSGGNFTLTNIPPGNTTLNFSTPGFNVSISINIAAGSVVDIIVTIEPNNQQQPIVIGDMGIAMGPIRCEDSDVIINQDIVIDGAGLDDCIRAEDDCSVIINSGDVLLTNCERCVDAEDASSVSIAANSVINCDANEDGVRAKDDAIVSLSAGNNISIISILDNGIRSEDNSEVSIDSTSCFIQGGENAIRIEDSAIVDTSGCTELTISDGPSPLPSPSPSPAPSPSPSP